jgi:threonine dehydrogenase-like Zn-dependent dehydrogenase
MVSLLLGVPASKNIVMRLSRCSNRFDVAWSLVRKLRPSRLLTTRVVGPAEVGEAFAALDKDAANTLAVLIDYGTTHP